MRITNTNKMEQTTDKQMTLAEFKQWVESMEKLTWGMVTECKGKNIPHAEIWQNQWGVFSKVNEILKNVSCE